MEKYINLFIIVGTMFCFTFNSTFPLERDASIGYTNQSQKYVCLDRTKRISSNFGNTLRKIKDTTQYFGKNIYDHFNIGSKSLAKKCNVNEDDVRSFEQLVIMKKYPYLDIRELDMKYFPNIKKIDNLYMDQKIHHEASLSEPVEELLNVEIINRGLTGFAIPPHLSKHRMIETKPSTSKPSENPDFVLRKKSSNQNILKSLTEDINALLDHKNIQGH
ncbi:uncharacterized protein LOC125067465 [Vanessa atalanta]|uniref:uncharacterized protein LOC125067465 n=1 Tax=Vanessa atalanta TaxID=42275 RepID=UPI001FCDE98C|nr:uncharacterized protein LOC125067465 [Vanessa atalanta]